MELNKITILIIIPLATGLSSFHSYGQGFTAYNSNDQGTISYQIDPVEKAVKGTPYYSMEWNSGIIYFDDSTTVLLDHMNYNFQNDEIIFIINKENYIVPNKIKILGFKIGEQAFVGEELGSTYVFFQEIESGKNMTLLKRTVSGISRGEPAKGYIQATYDKYVNHDFYYVTSLTLEPLRINVKKPSTLLDQMKDKKELIDQYIKTKKLKLKKLSEQLLLVQYYNTL
ncbi:MAG: hypothetical protein GY816_10175 [Cytophagales bacterium]|nr:hypothetical protein [Cytophagales bacterium]